MRKDEYISPRVTVKKLSLGEYISLCVIAKGFGPQWKKVVRDAWNRGHYNWLGLNSYQCATLQSVRNKLSPTEFGRLVYHPAPRRKQV